MKKKLERGLLVAVLIVGLSGAWLGSLDYAATGVVDAGLKRALISFASARTMNAALSVVQSAGVSSVPVPIGLNITVGQMVHPINQVVGQFADLMLAASVAFGVMKFLIIMGSYKGIAILLSFAAIWWGWLRWHGKFCPTWLTKTLVVLVLVRFAVPVVSVGSDVVFNELLKDKFAIAQQGIAIDGNWLGNNIMGWLKNPLDIPQRVQEFKQAAEGWVGHMVELIVLFLLQTLVVPLLFFWILYRSTFAMLNSTRLQPEANR